MILLTFLAASLVFVCDRVAKTLLLARMSEGESIPVLRNIFHITLVFNKGIAFGLLKEFSSLFPPLTILTVGLILSYIITRKGGHTLTNISCGLIIGGAIGNLIDRIKLGYVIDFLDFRIWPVFNIADSSITIGAILFAFTMIGRRTSR